MNRFDCRGYLVKMTFGREKRDVYPIPGVVETRTWVFGIGATCRAQSLIDAHETLNALARKRANGL
jgi:hypothetical protein